MLKLLLITYLYWCGKTTLTAAVGGSWAAEKSCHISLLVMDSVMCPTLQATSAWQRMFWWGQTGQIVSSQHPPRLLTICPVLPVVKAAENLLGCWASLCSLNGFHLSGVQITTSNAHHLTVISQIWGLFHLVEADLFASLVLCLSQKCNILCSRVI